MHKQSRTLRRFRLTRSVVFVCSSDVLFAQCCQLFWIVHFWLSLRFSLTFIQFNWTMRTILVLYVTTLNMLALIISMLTNKRIILSNRSYIASFIQYVTSLMQKQNKYIYACATKCWSSNSDNNQLCCRTLYLFPFFVIIVGLVMFGLWCLTPLSTIF
jgi:hypothetical protein